MRMLSASHFSSTPAGGADQPNLRGLRRCALRLRRFATILASGEGGSLCISIPQADTRRAPPERRRRLVALVSDHDTAGTVDPRPALAALRVRVVELERRVGAMRSA